MEDASPEMLSIFAGALEQSSPEKRAAFLDTACGANDDFRQRIEALLKAHDKAGGFLQDEPQAGNTVATVDEPIAELPGSAAIPYAFALLEATQGDTEAAAASLAEAIRREPRLRDEAGRDALLKDLRGA